MSKKLDRNLNPTAEAIFAMFHWHKDYAERGGGSMDFYDQLTLRDKDFCSRAAFKIGQAVLKKILKHDILHYDGKQYRIVEIKELESDTDVVMMLIIRDGKLMAKDPITGEVFALQTYNEAILRKDDVFLDRPINFERD